MRCLLLHGLGGGPFELDAVAAALAAAGHSVNCPVLPGHGGAESAYLATTWLQWRDFARETYRRERDAGPVLVLGYSLGGLLCLDIAENGELPPTGVCCLATPLWLRSFWPFHAADWRLFFLPHIARLMRHVRLPARSAESERVAPWPGFQVMSLRHLADMHRAMPAIRRNLASIRSPLCVITLAHDLVCPPFQAAFLVRRSSSPRAALHVLRVPSARGGHLPAAHLESREEVAALCADFASRCERWK